MSRTEMYPWSALSNVGDYFIVPESLKPYGYISMMVSQRNYKDKSQRLSTARTSLGSMVMLTSVEGVEPPYDDINEHGIFIKKLGVPATRSSEPVEVRASPFEQAKRVVTGRKLTQSEIIARMSYDERVANLPWWHDPKTGRAVLGKVMTRADVERYVGRREPLPGPEVPYPKEYGLGPDLRRLPPEPELDDEEEEDWGEPPIITKYVDPDTGEVVEDAESE